METLHQKDYKTTEWAGGVTREIYISPAHASLANRDFDLRISSAIIDLTESNFSDFTGFTRYILPLEGDITLFRGEEKIVLDPDKPFKFDGGEQIRSANSKGAIDFNVIVKAGKKAEVAVVSEYHSHENAPALIFALDNIEVSGIPVARHDSLLTNDPFDVHGRAIVVAL